jgi:glycine/D-amino acid oxidase-like deaminating enzyme
MDRREVIVVGGGVIGLSIAWRAARSGIGVTLLERDRFGRGATHAAAGMLAPVAEADFGDAGRSLVELGLTSAASWPRFAAGLENDSGLPSRLRADGTLVLARDRDEAEALERQLAYRRRLGLAVAQPHDLALDRPDRNVAQRGDGSYVLGASSEERGFDTTVTARPLYELLRDASELVPGLLDLEVEEITVGLRPGSPNNLPLIGASDERGLILACGHFRNGILLAPLTAELVLRGLDGAVAPAFVRAGGLAPDEVGV